MLDHEETTCVGEGSGWPPGLGRSTHRCTLSPAAALACTILHNCRDSTLSYGSHPKLYTCREPEQEKKKKHTHTRTPMGWMGYGGAT
jgi:hypothetical protein